MARDPAAWERLAARATELAAAVRFLEAPGAGDELHVYGRRAAGEALASALDELPRLVEELKQLSDDLREAREAAARRLPAPAPRAADAGDLDEELGSLLSAAFRVTPAMTRAAKDDPLAALAVQAAKALAPEAPEVDRARLIAMAFAAAEGDLDAFWTARRQRAKKKKKDGRGRPFG